MKDQAVRQKILEATISSIEKYGIEGCTIRNIAKEAGMTFSSLHYYFESKDKLVEEAMTLAISGFFEDLAGIWQNRADDHHAIVEMLTFLFDGAIRYPGITRTGLYPLLMNGQTDGLFIMKLNAFLNQIVEDAAQRQTINKKLLSLKLSHAFSAVLFLGISPKAFEACSGTDFFYQENRVHLVQIIANDLLNQ